MRRSLARILFALLIFLLAFGAGFFLSSDLGEEQIRREAERQLASLLGGTVSIERVDLALHRGLELEGSGTTAWHGPDGPAVSVERVRCAVSAAALLTGRFRLRWLSLEGVQVRIDRTWYGAWRPDPVETLVRRERDGPAGEPGLGLMRGLQAVARALLERPLVARVVEVHDASIRFVDARPRGPDAPALELRLESFHGRLEHYWFGDAQLVLAADLVDETGTRAHLEVEGRREGDHHLRLSLASTDARLGAFAPYALSIHEGAQLSGDASGVFVYASDGPDHATFELDWVLSDLRTAVPHPDAERLVPIESRRVKARAVVELEPDHLRVEQARLAAGALQLDVTGALRRPLAADSLARLSLTLEDLPLAEVRSVLGWLPGSLADAVAPQLDRIEAGRLARLGVRGSGRLSDWGGLAGAEGGALPHGFVVYAELDGVTLAIEEDRLTDVRGVFEWSENAIEARDLRGSLDGEPLPALDLRVAGVSSLLASTAEARAVSGGAEPMPGLGALARILSPPREEGEARPERAPPPLRVELHRLEHPALLWPLENVVLELRPARIADGEGAPASGDLHVRIQEGAWAGVAVRGEGLWLQTPEPRITVGLDLGGVRPPAPAAPQPFGGRRAGDGGDEAGAVWARGRFELGPLAPSPSGPRAVAGEFVALGSTLRIAGLEAPLDPAGVLRADGDVRLDRSDEVAVTTRFALAGLDMSAVWDRFGRDPEGASGTLDVVGSLEGALRPGEPILGDLAGLVSVEARDGELQQQLPLLAALAGASQSLFSSRDSVRYDRFEALVEVERGLLLTDALAIDGPDLRLAGRGTLRLVPEPHEIDAFVGVSVLRPIDFVVEKLPLLKLLRGRDQNLIGAYFAVTGTWEEPRARLTPLRGLAAELTGFLERDVEVDDLGRGS